MKTGKVLWYNVQKGRGAIRGDDGQDYLVLWKAFKDWEKNLPDPPPGAAVEFKAEERDGLMMAAEVELK